MRSSGFLKPVSPYPQGMHLILKANVAKKSKGGTGDTPFILRL
jgi:hypothetical protein